MAIQLTEGAISMMYDHMAAENSPELDIKPVLQVIDVKQLISKRQSSATANSSERYRVLLSDGLHIQQGMLYTKMNNLVHSGMLQKGSVVQLSEFTCNITNSRMIVIIMDMKVILKACDIIGEPIAHPAANGGPALVGGSSMPVQPSMGRPNFGGVSQQLPGTDQAFDSNFPTNSDSGRFTQRSPPPTRPEFESSAGLHGSLPLTASYNDQSTGLPNNVVSQSPLNSYARQLQPSFQQQQQQQQQQRSPMYTNRAPAAKIDVPRIIPIDALNPYMMKWTIRARVTSKSALREFNNAKGTGKVFSFDLLDKDGGEIRVTCFNQVADKFFNVIESGKLYYISNGSLKPAQRAFNHLRNNLEITLDRNSTIQECPEDDSSIPGQQFYFCNISDLEAMENNKIVDVIGVVTSITPPSTISRKGSGGETVKRSLQLKDMSGRSIELTIWGNFSMTEGDTLQQLCESGVNPVLAVKSARVYDYNGKALGTIATSQLFINPSHLPNTRILREWFDNEGKNTPSECLSKGSTVGNTEGRKTISQIKDEQLGTSDNPDWIVVSASVSFIKPDNFCYSACRICSKKVINNEDGTWVCDKCNMVFDDCEFRYILQLQIQDFTGSTWTTAFQECGEEIMGISARDLYEMKYEREDMEGFGQVIDKVLFSKYLFKLRVKAEFYNDEHRVKSTVVKAEKVKWDLESKYLLELIDKVEVGNVQPAPIKGTREFEQANQAGQYGNRYPNHRVLAPTGLNNVSCTNCGGFGHSFASCTSFITEPGNGECVGRVPPANSSGTPGRYGGGLRQSVGGF